MIKDITSSIYHKSDLTVLWLINTTEYCQRLMLAYFMYKQTFRHLDYANCCDNCIYADVSLKITPEFKTQRITTQISMK